MVPDRIGIIVSTTITNEQPGNLFRMMSTEQQQILFDNTARAMARVSLHIKERHTAHCAKADPAYGAGVASALQR